MKKSNVTILLESIEGKMSKADMFHQKTKYKTLISQKSIRFPKEWINIHFKTYPRFERILLDETMFNNTQFTQLMTFRESIRKYSNKAVTKKEISHILLNASGITRIGDTIDESRRSYPSAGARYPLEIYPVILNSSDIEKGLYHFNVLDNSLELLLKEDLHERISEVFGGEKFVRKASVIFIITAVFGRTMIKYKDRGYRFLHLETGHLAQNICLVSLELGLDICPMGGFIDDKIHELLDIDSRKEFAVYTLVVGKK